MITLRALLPEACWKGYKMVGMKKKNDKLVPNCVPTEESNGSEHTIDTDEELKEFLEYVIDQQSQDLKESEYHGHKVSLNKPMRGDVKKFKVFVKDPKNGNVKKVNFGDPNMRIKKSNPKRRKSFRARHHCESPGPKTKARYWSCRKW